MIKLGLIGAHITHSKSPLIYQSILKTEHTYSLIDVREKALLPRLSDLNDYYGLNLTAPWKKSFFDQLSSFDPKWEALNCLKNLNGNWIGTNTDALALKDLIPELRSIHSIESWVLLGDGAMAMVTKSILTSMGLPFYQFARGLGDDFNQFSFLSSLDPKSRLCLINCCSRDLVIRGSLSKNWIFWDYNYSHLQHMALIPSVVKEYVDGSSLLNLQAKHAVKFWDLL